MGMDSDDLERLSNEYDELYDQQRRALGLHGIAKAAELNPQQTSFLEQTFLDPSQSHSLHTETPKGLLLNSSSPFKS